MIRCNIDNMTVDAGVHADVIEVETMDGMTKYIVGLYREPVPINIYCSDCGTNIPVSGRDIDEMICKHLEEA